MVTWKRGAEEFYHVISVWSAWYYYGEEERIDREINQASVIKAVISSNIQNAS